MSRHFALKEKDASGSGKQQEKKSTEPFRILLDQKDQESLALIAENTKQDYFMNFVIYPIIVGTVLYVITTCSKPPYLFVKRKLAKYWAKRKNRPYNRKIHQL
jgi:hypothetical protein